MEQQPQPEHDTPIEEQLRLSEARYRSLVEARAILDTLILTAPVGLAFVSRDFRYLQINETLAALNGFPVEAHLGRTPRELFADSAYQPYVQLWEGYWQQVLTTGEAIVGLEISAVLNERASSALVSYYPVRGPGGEIFGIGIVVIDQTEHKQAEKERARLFLAAQEAEALARQHAARMEALAAASKALSAAGLDVQAILAQLAQLAAATPGDGCLIRLRSDDGQLLVPTAYAHSDPEVRAFLQLLSEGPHDVAEGVDGVVFQTGQPLLIPVVDQAQLRAALKPEFCAYLDRYSVYSLLVVPLRVRGEAFGTLGVSRMRPHAPYTLDDQRFLQELADRAALAINNAQLYHAAKQAVGERDTFLSIAAHELKTPLTALLGQAQLLGRRARRESVLGARDLRAVQVIEDQTRRLSKMVADLLDLSRIEGGQLQIERVPLDVALLATRVVDEMQITTEQHVLRCEVPSEALVVLGDELRLEQAMHNLISNAVKYSPSGSTVAIRVTHEGCCACLSVVDQGIGIPQEALPRLTERFYRAPNAAAAQIGGVGVGLYVVKEIVTRHEGTLAIESVEGQGSTFTIQLPLAPRQADEAA
jgi:signal transduction histidine kinase